MTALADRLIMQSIGPGDDFYVDWLKLSRPIHEQYAAACDADYQFFVGAKDVRIHPAWNRVPMFLAAFAAGYRKVVWLDADTLVVKPDANIFAETDNGAPLQMTRVIDSHVEIPWGEPGWDVYNDGVLVANNTADAVDAFEYVWSMRQAPALRHHHVSLWELNWLLDYVFANPDAVKLLDVRWNWMPFAENLDCEADAAICAWHGMPHEERARLFREKYAETYGIAA